MLTLLEFKKPVEAKAGADAIRSISAALEEWLVLARQGHFAAIGLCVVGNEGQMMQRIVHSGPTAGLLLASNRMMEATIVQQLLTTYKSRDSHGPAPSGSVAPPPGDLTNVPEGDEDE